jgi:hypothetical protein
MKAKERKENQIGKAEDNWANLFKRSCRAVGRNSINQRFEGIYHLCFQGLRIT